MFRLLVITLAVIGLSEAAISNLQLVVPDDSYALLTSGKVSTASSRGSSSITLSNAISEEDISSSADNDNEPEDASSTPAASAATATATSAPSAAPAAITRVRPSSSLSAISSSGLSRSSLLISSTASAQASSSSSTVSASASSPSGLARSSTTIHHRILPAETIPLPITISTRPGLRTVIAPETITIQQPTIAKVGEVVQQIPTAVSHQRQTVVHNHARVVTPIVAPSVRTITSQVVRAYHTPLIYAPQQPTIQVVNN